jgi:hypothetical protein
VDLQAVGPLESGGVLVSREIRLEIEVETVRQD